MAEVPETGNIELDLDFTIADLTNGEKRIVSQETGCSIQALMLAISQADGMINVVGFDIADLEYAFGKIALRRKYGVGADTPVNADRVVLITSSDANPTVPSTDG